MPIDKIDLYIYIFFSIRYHEYLLNGIPFDRKIELKSVKLALLFKLLITLFLLLENQLERFPHR